jgi:hypothetical protein
LPRARILAEEVASPHMNSNGHSVRTRDPERPKAFQDARAGEHFMEEKVAGTSDSQISAPHSFID